jgi:hypothetical protein
MRMVGNVTSTQAMMPRLAQLQDEMRDEHASLAKAFCTVKCREAVGYARELLGGNGILLENHIGRFVADAEAISSYEGTREMTRFERVTLPSEGNGQSLRDPMALAQRLLGRRLEVAKRTFAVLIVAVVRYFTSPKGVRPSAVKALKQRPIRRICGP